LNPYTLGTPSGQFHYPTAQTQSQAGVQNTGGGGGEDAFLVELQQQLANGREKPEIQSNEDYKT
jgi:hypothetical protein